VLATVNSGQVKLHAELLLVVLNIGYVLWRWRRDARCNCRREGCPRPKRRWRLL
jgi:hypothetical protein